MSTQPAPTSNASAAPIARPAATPATVGPFDLDMSDWPLILSEEGNDGRTIALFDGGFADETKAPPDVVTAAAELAQAAPELRDALADLVRAICDMTSHDFALGADKPQREAARALLARLGVTL
jgi:hypothetical protein